MRTPSNWGLQAEPPTHPELLDWLALQCIRNNWSLKSLHRTILLSSTWQMSSQLNAEYQQRDPENRLLWRQNRRRLEAELVRDHVLMAGRSLDLTVGGVAEDVQASRRAIYLPINRSALYEMFSVFDYVETANHIEQRPVTTVPQQALFLLNSPMVHEQSRRLAQMLPDEKPDDPAERLGWLFEHLFARLPTDAEIQRSRRFIDEATATLQHVSDPAERQLQAWTALCRTLIASNEWIYLD